MNTERLLEKFSRYVACDSESGNERQFCELIESELRARGMTVIRDEVGEAAGSNGWNVYASLAGIGEPILFSAHMDTVPPGVGIEAIVENGVIRSKGDTILAADDKAGIAAVVEAIDMLQEVGTTHRPVEVLFTVGEETGLLGSKHANYAHMQSKEAIVLDNANPGSMINEAPAMAEIFVEITGRSAHAAIAPDKGIHAIKAAAAAIMEIPCGHADEYTVINVANLLAPGKSNVVPEKASFDIDLRSFDETALEKHIAHIEQAVKSACEPLGAKYTVRVERKADILFVSPEHPLVTRLKEVYEDLGIPSKIEKTYGGSDATWLFKNGIDAINIGIGMMDIHSTDEHITVADLENTTRVVYGMMQVT